MQVASTKIQWFTVNKFSENIIFPICNSANHSSNALYMSVLGGERECLMECFAGSVTVLRTEVFTALAQWWKR